MNKVCVYDDEDWALTVENCCPEEIEAWQQLHIKEQQVTLVVVILVLLFTATFDQAKDMLMDHFEKTHKVRKKNSCDSFF